MRQEHNGPIVAMETLRGTYYAGQEYDEVEQDLDRNIRWGDYVGDYYITVDKIGEIVSIKRR